MGFTDVILYVDICLLNPKESESVEEYLPLNFIWFGTEQLTVNYYKTYFMPFTSYTRGLPTFNTISLDLNSKTIHISTVQQFIYIIYISVFFDRYAV